MSNLSDDLRKVFLFGVGVNAAIVRNRVGQVEYSAGRIASYIQKKRRKTK